MQSCRSHLVVGLFQRKISRSVEGKVLQVRREVQLYLIYLKFSPCKQQPHLIIFSSLLLYIFQWNHAKGMRSCSIVCIQMLLQTPQVCMLGAPWRKARNGRQRSGFMWILLIESWLETAQTQVRTAKDGLPLENAIRIQNIWSAHRIF